MDDPEAERAGLALFWVLLGCFIVGYFFGARSVLVKNRQSQSILTSEFSGRNKRPRYPVGTTMKRASQGDIMPMPQLN